MAKDLKQYDFVLAIDKSGSMSLPGTRGKSRWQECQETAIALATKAAEYDDDGITVIPFANTLKVYDNVTPAKVVQIFAENEPNGGTDTAHLLQTVFDLNSSSAGRKPIILVIITDGEPNDRAAVKNTIIKFAQTLKSDDDFGILFLQIGNDSSATAFLKDLDSGLNAKFDIVATRTADGLESMTLTEALILALEG